MFYWSWGLTTTASIVDPRRLPEPRGNVAADSNP